MTGLAATGDSSILSLPGFVSLCIQVWMSGAREGCVNYKTSKVIHVLSGSHDTPSHFSAILASLHRIGDAPEVLIRELGVSPSSHNKLWRLQAAFSISALISTADGTQTQSNILFSQRMRSQKWVPALCLAFQRLLEKPSISPALLPRVLCNCLSAISLCFLSQGPPAVLEALAMSWLDILRASVEILRMEGTGLGFTVFQNAIKCLQLYSVHPSVLRKARRWFFQDGKSEQHVGQFEGVWLDFLQCLQSRITIRSEWKRIPSKLCGNEQCSAQDVEILRLQRCAGCLRVVYCSRSCQKQDWAGGHSRICQEGLSVWSTQKCQIDRDFITHLMNLEVSAGIRTRKDITDQIVHCSGDYPVVIRVVQDLNDEIAVYKGVEFLAADEWPYDEMAKTWLLRGKEASQAALLYGIILDADRIRCVVFDWLSLVDVGLE
ncbi:hypothetical protein C8J56DRAFT_1090645 [Mycena floridula]|nr:hypothetical protein C8J56DRAFT_1090645 [Mycena floridula]